MSQSGTLAPPSFLEANLAALARTNPGAAATIREAGPRLDVHFLPTDEAVPSADVGGRALASRRRPLAEAAAFAASVDISQAGLYLVAGCGLGYHVRSLLDRLKRQGLVVVFEPDVPLLRAVLERIDCTNWIGEPNLRLLTDPDDRAAIVAALHRTEGLVGLGARLVEHPSSRARLADSTARLYQHLGDVIDSVKMSVLTTIVQSRITIRNLTQNLDRYVTSGGIGDLAGVCRGRPALVISAGPSLARNIDHLAGREVRERFVLVAAQTVLKTLLARGVRPHFITALDWSDVGTRFYEGLSRADVEGITLVAEPKVNPAILDAWPGDLRCVGDGLCDRLLGPDIAHDRATLPPGATVAHLAYYLARHLGCDPVALVGQDLGFTDGQYYASGAAIHSVWAGEVNEFNTLEMLEWQRIVRQGDHLRRATDTLGRPIYTDEQMLTYLTQFERDFKEDAARGLTTIDATEGGVRKGHTRVQVLREFLGAHSGDKAEPIALPGGRRAQEPDARIAGRVRMVRDQVARVGELSREAATHLAEMEEHQRDQARVDRLIARLEPLSKEAVGLDPGYTLVHSLGQNVAFARMRADRDIHIETDLSPIDRQRRQVERDLANVRALAETAEQLAELLDAAVGALEGKPKITRDTPPDIRKGDIRWRVGAHAAATARVAAIIPVDPTAAHLKRPIAGSPSILAATIARLRRCLGLSTIALVGDNPEALRRLAAQGGVQGPVEFLATEPGELASRRSAALRARAWASACWRGGVYNASCYDEVYLPRSTPGLLDQLGASAALVLGPDWCCIDAALCHAVLARHAEQPHEHRFVFTQAAPGLAPCLVSRELASHLAHAPLAGPWSMPVGGVLGYVPQAPMNDLIAGPGCVPVPTDARDAGIRCIADSTAGREAVERAIASGGRPSLEYPYTPEHLSLEIAPVEPRRMCGAGDAFAGESLTRRVLDEFGRVNPEGRLTLALGGTDDAAHRLLLALIAHARTAGVGHVHVRTSLRCAREHVEALGASGADIISVDLLADTRQTYRTIAGSDDFPLVRENLEGLLGATGASPVVPRLTRCDAAYADVEPFFARWFERTGWCVIEPAPARIGNDRIAPLAIPPSALARQRRERLTILADGDVPAEPHWSPGAPIVGNARDASLADTWARVVAARQCR